MVVFGNLLGKEYDLDFGDSDMEIIYKDEDIKQIQEELKLEGKPDLESAFTTIYNKNKGNVVLYNANKLPVLEKIYRTSFSHGNLKFAPIIYAFIWSRCKAGYVHRAGAKDWENTVILYNMLKKTYFGKNTDEDLLDKIERLYYEFLPVMASNNTILISPYNYKSFDEYPREDLLDLFSTEDEGSIYFDLLTTPRAKFGITRDLCSFVKWKDLTYRRKIDAIIERISVDVCNEFLLDDILFSKRNSLVYSITDMIRMAMMFAVSHTENKWISNFILNNYNEIWANINLKSFELIYEAVEFDYLDRLKQ